MTEKIVWTGRFCKVIEEVSEQGSVFRIESDNKHIPDDIIYFAREDVLGRAKEMDYRASQIELFKE